MSFDLLCDSEARNIEEHYIETQTGLLKISVGELLNGVSTFPDRDEKREMRAHSGSSSGYGVDFSLPPSRKRVFDLYQSALEKARRLGLTIETDREVYDFVCGSNICDDGDAIPTFETFCRMLRYARSYYGKSKNSPRRSRGIGGRSVVRYDEIDHPGD